jgi:Formyl transferase
MRTLLICHHDAPLHSEGMAAWLASHSTLAGIVVLHEPPDLLWKRLKRERKRVGALRVLDVLAFRVYYRLVLRARDEAWKAGRLAAMRAAYPPVPAGVPVLHTHSPNSPEAEAFVREHAPDVTLALCKSLIKESVFSVPTHGTWVLHPGICPEYRNAHGCFWALVNRDLDKVGMTLLRIDRGVDTGPTYGYYTYPYDEVAESHVVIQNRVVLDNLEPLAAKFRDIVAGRAAPIDVRGRPSAAWGQPWLTSYLRWKLAARRLRRRSPRAGARAAVP